MASVTCASGTCHATTDLATCCTGTAVATCDKKTDGAATLAVTNAECGAVFFATVGATGACAAAPCDMSSAADKTACCTAVAGKCGGNAASAAGLAEASDPAGSFQFACGGGFLLKANPETIALAGADAAAKKNYLL